MVIVGLSESQRENIIEAVKPDVKNCRMFQNLNLLTAVYDEENCFYLTQSCCPAENKKRIGVQNNEYRYVIIHNSGTYEISCGVQRMDGDIDNLCYSPFLNLNKDSILTAIEYYNDHVIDRWNMGTNLAKQVGSTVADYSAWYLKASISHQERKTEWRLEDRIQGAVKKLPQEKNR